MRIHRAYIANLDRVTAFHRAGRRRFAVKFDNGVLLAVSRTKAAAIRSLGL